MGNTAIDANAFQWTVNGIEVRYVDSGANDLLTDFPRNGSLIGSFQFYPTGEGVIERVTHQRAG